ncbi:MAG TPA: amino acid adenylation domain-containing protein [Micromonosporaceae bacterium]|nr:amino acid adenylation domain-containing protein [Micromonosporaceae bacterium]
MARTFTAPLSFAQEQLWFLDQLDPGRSAYNVPLAVRLSGPLDVAALRAAVTGLVRRQEALRTTIDDPDGVAVQVVAPPPREELPLEVVDAPPAPGEDPETAAGRIAQAACVAPFDLRRGPLDVAALRSAVTGLVRRQEALRTTIDDPDGVAVQVVAPPPVEDLPLEVVDAPPAPGEDPEAAAGRLAHTAGAVPFDLRRGPLFRPQLFRLAPDDHVLALTTHHIISDGWSMGLIVAEIVERYRAAVTGASPDLPELPVQYADFAAWQRGRLTGEALEEELRYWERVLAGAPVLDLPTDRPRPAIPSFQGGLVVFDISGGVVEQLHALSRAHRVTLYMTLMAAFNVVMSRYTGQEDVVIGTATAGRELPELKGMVGFFTNMVVLRTDLSGDPTFAEILRRARDVTLAAYAHQELPFEKVVERVAPRRDPSRNPLFQVAIGLMPPEPEGAEVGGGSDLRVSMMTPGTGGSRFDIAINVAEHPDTLRVWMEYATDLFDEARMWRMAGHFEQVLRAVVADPELPLSRVPMLTGAERKQVLHEWQGPVKEYRRVPIHQLIAEQAEQAPEAVAAVCAGEQLRYGELERRAGLLARYLRSRGVGHSDVVGVALERGLDVPVALLAVLKAGAAFLAVDPAHPPARVDYVLRDAGTRFVVTREAVRSRLPAAGDRELVPLDTVWPAAEALAGEPLPELAGPDSMAYVLYTSGSTGRPKGVVIEHGALCTFTLWMSGVFGIRPGDRMLQFASLVFDLAEGEIFTALTRGATLVLVPEDVTLSPPALAALIRDEQCTYVGAAPAMLGLVDAGPYPQLRGILVGGEAFSGELVNRWNQPGRTFVNGYGPTEVTIGCTYYVCDHIVWRSSPPIGRAMPNRTAYIVDRWDNPVPVGVPGELIVGGHGLARGYLGRPELTAERFVDDPFVPSGRVYRTGDLAQWTERGQIQFLGRIDTQVKLRGQRIELEEIEAVLATHPRVSQAVVALREDTPGEKRLVGYVVPDGTPPSVAQLREYLGEELPAYMVPAAFMVLDELPLAPTGKVDRPALPAPETGRPAEAEYLAPATPAEQTVADVFAEVLGVARVGADADFFDLGGSSLQVAAVISRVRELTGVTLPMRDVYTTPTVAAVGAALAGALTGDTAPDGLVLTLQAGGDKPPLFCVPHVFGSALGYRGLVRHLPDDQPLYALESPGLDDDTPPVDTMPELAAVYVAALRERYPHGPYVLAGHSMGGVVAWEMALQLIDAGEQVRVILIESNIDLRPPATRTYIAQTFLDIMAGIAERDTVPLGDVDELPEPVFLERLLEAMTKAGVVDADLDATRLRRRYNVFAANARALWAYDPPRPLPGRVALVRSSVASAVPEGMWHDLAPDGLDEYVVTGDHYAMWSEPYLTGLGRLIAGLLATPVSHVSAASHQLPEES